jgi:hypothetical protein
MRENKSELCTDWTSSLTHQSFASEKKSTSACRREAMRLIVYESQHVTCCGACRHALCNELRNALELSQNVTSRGTWPCSSTSGDATNADGRHAHEIFKGPHNFYGCGIYTQRLAQPLHVDFGKRRTDSRAAGCRQARLIRNCALHLLRERGVHQRRLCRDMLRANESVLRNAHKSSALGVVHSLQQGQNHRQYLNKAYRTGQIARESSPGGRPYSQPEAREITQQPCTLLQSHIEACRLRCKPSIAGACKHSVKLQ